MKSVLPALLVSAAIIILANKLLPTITERLEGFEPYSQLIANLRASEAKAGFGEAPTFSLTDSDGETFSSETIEGPWLFNIFFTSCNGPCPTTLSNLKKVKDELGKNHPLKIISLSVDEEHDSPDALKKYANKHRLSAPEWIFLRGENQELYEIIEKGFQIGMMEEARFHSTRLVLVDKLNQIKGYYMGADSDDMKKLVKDVENL